MRNHQTEVVFGPILLFLFCYFVIFFLFFSIFLQGQKKKKKQEKKNFKKNCQSLLNHASSIGNVFSLLIFENFGQKEALEITSWPKFHFLSEKCIKKNYRRRRQFHQKLPKLREWHSLHQLKILQGHTLDGFFQNHQLTQE